MRSLLLLAALVPLTIGNGELKSCYVPFAKTSQAPKIDEQEHKCLATMIYGEARGESVQGMVAVAYTAVNRAVKKRICRVVLAPKQYSIFNNNPALRAAATNLQVEPMQKNVIDNGSWKRALKVAEDVMKGKVKDPTNGSTYYLAPIVMGKKHYHYPQWSKEYQLTVIIDRHRFYKQKEKA